MYKNDREIMIEELMKLKLQRKLLDEMSDGEIRRLFSILKRYVK
jgi:uncharacterized protein YaaW (UPF0174 family)|tara:strand:+ start:565 stop:696 length:132 start_codon:yes stop_codon:yes gene_type:complete